MSIPLISFDGKHFRITEQARQFFEEIKSIQQLAILSIIGKSRTGKSFFLNHVLLDSPEFEVSHTTNPCTKGIWISKKLIDSPTTPGLKILVMDVEGLGGIEDNSMNDNRIILLPLILSSYLIYNSMGYITEEAIRGIGVVVGFAKEIQTKENELFSFPFFHWIIRDFTLELMDTAGYPITQKQYLERSLDQQKGLTETVQNKNKIRRKFKEFFKHRDCSTLIRPYSESVGDLREQFVSQSAEIRKKVLSAIECKQIKGIKLSPAIFLQFIETIFIDINNGISPNIQNTWKIVYLEHEKDLLSKLEYKLFDEIEYLKEEQLPVAYYSIKFKFEQMFCKESFCSEHPSVEISNEIDRILGSIRKQIDEKMRLAQEKKVNEELQIFYEQLKQLNSLRSINSMSQIDAEVEQIIGIHRIMLEKADQIRMGKIKERIRMIVMEEVCSRLQVANKSLKEENRSLRSKSEQSSVLSVRMERQLRQLQSTVVRLKTDLQQSIKQKDILVRNLESELHSRKLKSQQQTQQICLLNQQLRLVENSEQYSRTLYRLEQLQRMLHSIQKQYQQLTQDQAKLKGHNFILQEEKHQLQNVILNLNKEAERREEQIANTQKRIVEQVEKEEQRIETILQEAQMRQKQKNQRIQKLERIIKETKGKPRQIEEVCEINSLREQLDAERNRNRKLERQIEQQKSIYESKLMSLQHRKPGDHKSAVMNLELTPKGFKMKSFKSPAKLKEWQKQKVCLQAQVSLQQQLNKQSKTLISSLLEKEQQYLNEINSLKERLSESYIQSEFSSVKSGKGNKNLSLLNNNSFSNISVTVPSFTIKTMENGHSITQYTLQFHAGMELEWETVIRYRNLMQILEYLSRKYPEVPEFKLPKTNKAEDKRKIMEKILRQCLLIHQFRTDQGFKSFIHGTHVGSGLVQCKSQQNIPRFGSPKGKFMKAGSKENIRLRSNNKNTHFSIYIDQ